MMQTCPNCGEKWDSSNRYTSPANAGLDAAWWKREHLSGACSKVVAVDPMVALTETGFGTHGTDDGDRTLCGRAVDEVRALSGYVSCLTCRRVEARR